MLTTFKNVKSHLSFSRFKLSLIFLKIILLTPLAKKTLEIVCFKKIQTKRASATSQLVLFF